MLKEPKFLSNISIKWKISAAFILSFLIPITLVLMGLSLSVVFPIGLAISMSLGIYSHKRILDTTENIQKSVRKQFSEHKAQIPAHSHYQDELSELLNSFDQLVSHFDQQSQSSTQKQISSETREQTIQAQLSTGDPAYGTIYILDTHSKPDHIPTLQKLNSAEALEFFQKAIQICEQQLGELKEIIKITPQEQGIIDFQIQLLKDPSLKESVEQNLHSQQNLEKSLKSAFWGLMQSLENSGNDYLKERVSDCEDLLYRLQNTIEQQANPTAKQNGNQVRGRIVFSTKLLPSEVIDLYKSGVAGIIIQENTVSSHTQILLQSLHIPSLSKISSLAHSPLKGQVLLNTIDKRVVLCPSQKEVEHVMSQKSYPDAPVIQSAVKSTCGSSFQVLATLNTPLLAQQALNLGADGIGLYRSEMSYVGKHNLPQEDELYEEYRQIVKTFDKHPVTLRMLDIGSDKIPSFAGYRDEENPCMGNRSMRFLIEHPYIFKTQLRAILRACSNNTKVIFPMISGWYELDIIQEVINEVRFELKAEGYKLHKPQFGIMVEVPSIVQRFEDYVREFDVFNIGTNDLVQYTLAADRNNTQIVDYYTPFHPSVLSMIQKICRISDEHGKIACLCGEFASQTEILELLVGLGVKHFSVPHALVPVLKNKLQNLKLEQCQTFAQEALQKRSSKEVKQFLQTHTGSIINN